MIRFLLAALLLLSIAQPSLAADSIRNSRLYRSLVGRNESVRMKALSSVGNEPAAIRRVLDPLIRAAKQQADETGEDEIVRHSTLQLIYLIAKLDATESESLLVELLDAPHLGIAMVSADALGKNKFFGSIEFLKRQIDRPEYKTKYAFRFNLVRSLAQMQHADAVEFLREMRQSLDGQLRYQVDVILEDVTMEYFQGDEERFARWQQHESASSPQDPDAPESADESKIVFKQAGYESESLNRINFAKPQYYGIDIHARRLMFIIDRSGSMKDYWAGQSRLERAKNELIRAVTELPADSEFAILFYDTYVKEWRDRLVVASDDNKREAIQFVRRLGYGDRTNTYGALRRSLEFDDDLESVFLLTDGRPTIGDITAPSGIINDILHRNRFRHLNFNTIGIAVQGPTESFLKRLAEQTNGEFRKAL